MSFRAGNRTYTNALTILQSRRRPQRPSIESQSDASKPQPNSGASGTVGLRGSPSIVGMKEWLRRIGHSPANIDKLNIIHIAGTKGKGSTCAFTECILRAYGQRTGFPRKTGLYTSPHLIYPEERTRINFQPISKGLFTKYFFEVWDALSISHDDTAQNTRLPRYLQLLALVSFHAFIREGVETAILETHHGGEYDATNFIDNPIVTVITTLGMDHVKQLGPTIDNIAWHKSGIFKAGARAISSSQQASAAQVLQKRAEEKGVELTFVEDDDELPRDAAQLRPDVQRMNCSVALEAARQFLDVKAPKELPPLSSEDVDLAIKQFSWPGRFQYIREEPCFNWFLDGAHNEMSVIKAAKWFAEGSQEHQDLPATRLLIFSQVTQTRESEPVLLELARALLKVHIHHVIFTTYDPEQDFTFGSNYDVTEADQTPHNAAFGGIWKEIHPDCEIHYESNVQKALNRARDIGSRAGGMHTLITGSQHLIGAVLHSMIPNTAAPETTYD